jgi:signal transduction histidine kinase
VVISVSDTGTGIPPENVSRVFERFYKADRARASAGTGLGLAIAKHTIEAHQGRIWVESQQGRGSTFFIRLPRAPQEAAASAPGHSER